MTTHQGHLLVVLAPGVGLADADGAWLAQLRATLDGAPPRALRRSTGGARASVLLDDELACEIRRQGTSVDRSSLLLRPAWSGDDAVLRRLERRPRGPAGLTILGLQDARAAAERHGAGGREHTAALRHLLGRVARAREILRFRGAPPRTCLLGLGPMRPVASWFDPLPELPRGARRRARCSAAALRIEARSARELQQLDLLLRGEPFVRHGVLLSRQQLLQVEPRAPVQHRLLVPRPGTAFGPVRAVWPYLPEPRETPGLAVLPWSRPDSGPTTLEHVAAKLLALCAARQPRPEPARGEVLQPDAAVVTSRA